MPSVSSSKLAWSDRDVHELSSPCLSLSLHLFITPTHASAATHQILTFCNAAVIALFEVKKKSSQQQKPCRFQLWTNLIGSLYECQWAREKGGGTSRLLYIRQNPMDRVFLHTHDKSCKEVMENFSLVSCNGFEVFSAESIAWIL